MECLGSETVALYVGGGLSPGLRVRADAHVDRCPACRTWIARAARMATRDGASATAPSSEVAPWPARGTSIGRYVVDGVVGRGAMGVVLRALDPVLGRSVALKLLHRAADSERMHAALLGEARSLARLSDPHVVQVFDTETWCGRLVLAMELVEGSSLRRAAERADRPERLRMLLSAARGLAAAHKAGIVHRDFKPDNVLVADDGRILVGDFGLAVLADSDRTQDGMQDEEVIAGTPAYMPPEQREGASVDARADQFAFCVSAVEVLLGWRPQAIDGLREATRFSAATRSLPRPLAKALARGLASAPERRAPTMDTLIAALERVSPRSWTPLLFVVPVLAALLLMLPSTVEPQRAEAPSSSTLVGDPVAVGLAHALLGASVASYVTGDIAAARAFSNEAVLTAETSEDPATIVRALVDRGELSTREGDLASALEDFEQAHMLARHHRLDREAATIALTAARMLGRDPERAEAALGWLRLVDPHEGDELQRARIASTRARLELDREDSAAALVECRHAVEAMSGEDVANGDELAALLRGAERHDDTEGRYSVLGVIDDVAAVWCVVGRCRDSVVAGRVVVQRLIEQFGPDHVEVAIARVNVSSFLGRAEDPAGACVELEAAIAVLEQEPRPDPPALAIATQNLAVGLHAIGEPRRAHEIALVGLTRTEVAFGPGSPHLIDPMVALAQIERTLGETASARRYLERALVNAEQAFGEKSGTTAFVLSELALHARAEADRRRARAAAQRAMDLHEQLGTTTSGRASAIGTFAWSILREDPERARALLHEELRLIATIRERREANPRLSSESEAIAWRTLAEAEHRLGQDVVATELRRRAIEALIALEGADGERVAFARLPLGSLL